MTIILIFMSTNTPVSLPDCLQQLFGRELELPVEARELQPYETDRHQ